jgi:hypothetical protein
MDALEASRDYLASQIGPCLAEKEKLLARIAAIEAEIGPIEAALAALTKTKQVNAAKSLKKKDVHAAVALIAKENPGVTRLELEELAKDKLKEELGFGLRGFTHLFNKCLLDGSIQLAACDAA